MTAASAVPVSKYFNLTTSKVLIKLKTGDTTQYDFSAHIKQVELNPNAESTTWTAINGESISLSGKASWSVTWGCVQDLDAKSFQQFLMSHEATTAEAEIEFIGGGRKVKFEFSCTAPTLGGTANQLAESSVTCPVIGKPVWQD